MFFLPQILPVSFATDVQHILQTRFQLWGADLVVHHIQSKQQLNFFGRAANFSRR